LEEIRFLPTKMASRSTEGENLKFLEERIHDYFRSTLTRAFDKNNPDVFYNDIGMEIFTGKSLLAFGAIWGMPCIALGYVAGDMVYAAYSPSAFYNNLFTYFMFYLKD